MTSTRPDANRSPAEPSRRLMSSLLERSGVVLSPRQVDQLWTYHQLIRRFNAELNLTRVRNFANMVLKLYVDSMLPGRLIDLPSPLMDLGTGPGMPAIPLKIAHPHLELVLAESRRRRVEFLQTACETLKLEGVQVIGRSITPEFEMPVAGVITRALEPMADTLERVDGCLAGGGFAVFMKGPRCDPELEEAQARFAGRYRLENDIPYVIAGTPHRRRLVVFRRVSEPAWSRRREAMKRHTIRTIASPHNETFKDLKKLLGARGIKKQQRALLCGPKLVAETLRDFPGRCLAWITSGERLPVPPEAPEHLEWHQLTPELFQILDTLGTAQPLLLVEVPPIEPWDPQTGLPAGCSVVVPFQDPENVGAVIRSAVAFGARQVILLAESAHPYHPKAVRASGGTVLRARLLAGPSLKDLPRDLELFPLSVEGSDIRSVAFPETFGLLAGLEGSGLDAHWRGRAVAVPISPRVESLNAATATAIALYVWAQQGPRPPWSTTDQT